MNILYLTKGDHVDYQNDCLLIGLKELFGSSVVDYNKQAHNYITYDEQAAKKLYGRGMTVTRVLPDLEVDRTDITSKIKNKFFDYIVYGSIWRFNSYINNILEYYPSNKIAVVDGEDEANIHPTYKLGVHYFKRELLAERSNIKPISFAMPTTKINFNKNKIKDSAFITPLDRSTYVYDNEADYYNDYNQARFGVTKRKAGWDCLRHYEILGNGCLPAFIDIEQCPQLTMVNFPKTLCINVNRSYSHDKMTAEQIYSKYVEEFEKHFFENNTTKALAKYFINSIS